MEKALLVGTGGFGRTWWSGLARLADRIEVVAVVEPDERERASAGSFFNLPADRRLRPGDDDWAALDATVVIDSSPPWYHLEHAVAAFAAGCDLLVAKPLAPTAAGGIALMRAAESAGRSVAVAQQMRYFPNLLALRDAVRQQLVGPPVAARIRMALDGRGWTPGMQWRLTMDHPLLREAGIHHFDLMRWCLDTEFDDIAVVTWSPPASPFSGDASAAGVLRGANGVAVSYDATFAPGDEPAIRFDSGWSVVCRDGVLTVADGGLTLTDPLSGQVTTLVAPTADPVSLDELNAALLEDWLRARADGGEPAFSGADNLLSLGLMDRAMRWSAREQAK
ncbi:Gfo/Idh/MocA family oxidoreductase [Streptomyces sp. MI02-7b]|uniref:Gfo/Idh/MocA family protein n=1 Tax=Streptomyces sp. MI02-7b TaxID=462941 RepID=UPI0029A6B84A|nr:Gfo/Idh/MocA family oxidoreductase [Streptomyces sp. MI02-7b]MDX3078373.1 Gfo/Idh/MocA family oxidoreductase [Streptomyces sp. MI02-7b]